MGDREQVTLISPVHQTPDVLEPVLRSWIGLLDRGVDHIILVNDHSPKESVEMMRATATVDGQDQITVVGSGLEPNITYSKSDVTHNWQPEALSRISKLRGRLLDLLTQEEFAPDSGYALMVDSDLLIRPDVVQALVRLLRSGCMPWMRIISPIFWTKWMPDQPLMPQVWDQHPYGYNGIPRQRIEELRKPGLHQVNGLGACTLLPVSAMQEYVRGFPDNIYAPIPGLERGFNGLEDRHFCTRMTCNGFELYGLGVSKWEGEGTRAVEVDPGVFHVYRSTDVARAWELVKEWEERFK